MRRARQSAVMPQTTVPSPIGPIKIRETGGAITRVAWGTGAQDETPLLQDAKRQLLAYFAQEITEFDLPVKVEGSDLQRKACDVMRAIPFGETRTYGDLAKELGVPAQAVGQACGGNPIPIIIPCHRILGANGLGGFSGGTGIESKVWLLRHEGAASLLI